MCALPPAGRQAGGRSPQQQQQQAQQRLMFVDEIAEMLPLLLMVQDAGPDGKMMVDSLLLVELLTCQCCCPQQPLLLLWYCCPLLSHCHAGAGVVLMWLLPALLHPALPADSSRTCHPTRLSCEVLRGELRGDRPSWETAVRQPHTRLALVVFSPKQESACYQLKQHRSLLCFQLCQWLLCGCSDLVFHQNFASQQHCIRNCAAPSLAAACMLHTVHTVSSGRLLLLLLLLLHVAIQLME